MLRDDASIHVDAGDAALRAVAESLADALRRATGYALPVVDGAPSGAGAHVRVTADDADAALGDEGYVLDAAPAGVTIRATTAAGAFYGAQTFRQLLPEAIESTSPVSEAWVAAAVHVEDAPRFGWRGLMLDVARHFFPPEDVKRLVDLAARFKMNRFHIHLSDDQGWRIAIASWPDLATIGGSTEVGGGPGGFYTQEQYADIVAYAAERFVTVVPEIDMPGHCNAALASYAELTCDGVAPELYTGTAVGFSTLCLESEATYDFVGDVLDEISALTPGGYLHIGGDEAHETSEADYAEFIAAVEPMVAALGKRMVGWEEIANGGASSDAIVQSWFGAVGPEDLAIGAEVILSPATRAYLDMKYDASTPVGHFWAGYTEVDDAYDWDPAVDFDFPEEIVLGVEAPLWTETVEDTSDIDLLVFPRVVGHAEIGWTPAEARDLDDYLRRLGAHGPRLDALGVGYHRSELVPWAEE